MPNPRRRISPTPRYNWPVVIPRPTDPGGGGGGSDGGGSERDVRITSVTDADCIPIVYGRTYVGGKIFAVGVAGNDLVVAYAITLAANGIGQYEKILVDDKENPAGVTVYSYDGTQTSVCPALSAAFSGYTETHAGLAYIVLRISPGSEIFGGIPNLRVLIRGRKVWTGSSYAYSDNPAWIARDILTAYDVGNISTSKLNDASFSAAASFFAETVNGHQRYTAKMVIDSQTSPCKAVNDILSFYGGGLYLDQNGKLAAYFLRDYGPVDAVISDSDIVLGSTSLPSIQLETESVDGLYNHSTVEYEAVERGGETYSQTAVSYIFQLTGGAPRRNTINGEFIGSSSSVPGHVTAMRIAEEDMVWNMHNKERVRFSYLNYIAPGSVIRVKPFGYWRKAFAMDGAAYQITPDGSITAPSTALRVAIYFRLDGSSGQLISWGSSPNGFSVDVSQTQYTIRLGSYTGTVARKNSAGIPVRFAMCWAASYNKCYVFENGILLGSLTPGISTVAASGNFTVGSGFVGAIELIQVHASASLAATGFISVLAPTPPGYVCVCPWYSQQNGTWSTQPQIVDYEQPFVVERCIANETGYYDIIARAFTRRSLNAGTAPTSNNLVVSSYDSKPAGVGGPNPNDTPPSISGLFASATAYVQDNQTKYRVNLSWTTSNSSFVRGYNIYVNVGGSGDKLLAQLARNSNGYEYDVANPSLNHVFTVVPINLFGNAGSGASTSIIPESSAVGIQSIGGFLTYRPGLFSFNNAHLGTYGTLSVSVVVTGLDKIARAQLFWNEMLLSSIEPTSTNFSFNLQFDQSGLGTTWNFTYGWPAPPMAPPPPGSGTYYVVLILKNGNKISQSFSPLISYVSGFAYSIPNPPGAPVFVKDSQSQLDTPSWSPSPGDVPYKAPSSWEYRRFGGGAVTIPNGSTSAYAPFYVTFSSTPGVFATPQGNQMVWVTNVTTTGCTINRATTSGDLVVSYLAFGS